VTFNVDVKLELVHGVNSSPWQSNVSILLAQGCPALLCFGTYICYFVLRKYCTVFCLQKPESDVVGSVSFAA
jgi:hypothetical protein